MVLWLCCRRTVNQMHCLSTFNQLNTNILLYDLQKYKSSLYSQLNTNILLYDLQKYKSSLYGQLNTRKKLAAFKNNVAT